MDLNQYTRGFTNLSPTYAVFSAVNGTVGLSGRTALFTNGITTNGLGLFKFKVTDNTGFAYKDADVVFPLRKLHELAAAGTIGSVAPRAFSFMGYIPDTGPLMRDSGPEVARALLADAVDLVLLVPS